MTTTTSTPVTTTTWTIDGTHSLVEFSAKHLMITTVKGRFGGVAGEIVLDTARPARSRATVAIEAGSIDTRTEQRDQHLKSADFLDVEQFPRITFESTRVEGSFVVPGDRFRLIGALTIRGTTREVALDAVYEGATRDPWGGERVSFSAATTIDRRDFGLTWNVALETGGILVGNEIRITLEIQGQKAA